MAMPPPMYTAVPSPSQLPWPLLARLRLAFPLTPKSLSSSFSLAFLQRPYSSLLPCSRSSSASKRSRAAAVRAVRQESPYEVLRVPPSATPEDIKRAYRKLALKYHPDVNKEANAQERFMRIKHAYNTLMNSKSRFNTTSNGANYSTRYEKEANAEEEQYYGIVDFFRDLQEELWNWDADLNREEKPRSLWEELAEIGEEFVEFLEKELNVQETYFEDDSMESRKEKQQENEAQKQPSVEDSIDEVEAALAQLKKELGL